MTGDALVNPLRFTLTDGQRHNITEARSLIADFESEDVIADRGCDADEFRHSLLEQNKTPVIPRRARRKNPAEYDEWLYRDCLLVE